MGYVGYLSNDVNYVVGYLKVKITHENDVIRILKRKKIVPIKKATLFHQNRSLKRMITWTAVDPAWMPSALWNGPDNVMTLYLKY